MWAETGYLKENELLNLRKVDSILEGHPVPVRSPSALRISLLKPFIPTTLKQPTYLWHHHAHTANVFVPVAAAMCQIRARLELFVGFGLAESCNSVHAARPSSAPLSSAADSAEETQTAAAAMAALSSWC